MPKKNSCVSGLEALKAAWKNSASGDDSQLVVFCQNVPVLVNRDDLLPAQSIQQDDSNSPTRCRTKR